MFYRTSASAIAVLLVCGAADATPIKHHAGAVQQVLDVSESGVPQSTTALCSAGWVNLAGALLKVTVPSGANQLLTARFTATAKVSQGVGNIRIVAGTQVLLPTAGAPVINNGVYGAETAFESGGVVPGGVTRSVTVQYCMSVGDGGPYYEVDLTDWHLTVEAAPVQ